jgi:hypothetical protein
MMSALRSGSPQDYHPLNLWLSCSIIGCPQVTYKTNYRDLDKKIKYLFQFVTEKMKPSQYLQNFGFGGFFMVAGPGTGLPYWATLVVLRNFWL